MKCELCHKTDAETAIVRGEGDEAEELYVCNACAKAERLKQQKKSQRTRKLTGPGVSMSITEISPSDDGDGEGDEPPPFVGAIMDAFSGLVSDLEKAANDAKNERKPKYHDFSLARVDPEYRIGNRLHLEALHVLGELGSAKRALRALQMELVGVSSDGLNDVGHVYGVRYAGSSEQAKRVVSELINQERNARGLLIGEMPLAFADSLCRALATLKNCRLLSPGEYFDLLSAIRIAAKEKMFDGITIEEVEHRLMEIDLSGYEDGFEPEEQDQMDADRADEANRRFEDVVLNERAEGLYK